MSVHVSLWVKHTIHLKGKCKFSQLTTLNYAATLYFFITR